MLKAIFYLLFVVSILFGSLESEILQCDFKYNTWSSIGSQYSCFVTKGITINSLDTAYVNSSTESHQSGLNNDNVNYLYTASVAISYFPRGLDAIFKNLKGIRFDSAGMKEIHQSDLKPFPKLVEFLIYNGNQLEILEEGLFDFNPDLEYINLSYNKITHIDPKVFDSLTKLKQLHLISTTCINKGASDRTSVLNLINELKSKCNNSEYSTLDQKLKFFEQESKYLHFNDFKVELESIESKVNASKFVNFYQPKLNNLKNILDEKSFEGKNIKTLNVKFLNFITNLKNLTDQASSEIKNHSQEVDQSCENGLNIDQTMASVVETVDKRLDEFKENLKEQMQSQSKSTYDVITEIINKAVEKIEKSMMDKINESFKEFNKKVQENEKRFNERTANIMKTLKDISEVSDMVLNYSSE